MQLVYFIMLVYAQINCRVEMNISILITNLNLIETDSFYGEPGNGFKFKTLFYITGTDVQDFEFMSIFCMIFCLMSLFLHIDQS